MQFEFNPTKNDANQAKHGVALSVAEELEWDTLLCKPDDRQNYGERRVAGYALMGARLYCVVFVDRGSVRRVISLRKANNREKVLYAKIFNAS